MPGAPGGERVTGQPRPAWRSVRSSGECPEPLAASGHGSWVASPPPRRSGHGSETARRPLPGASPTRRDTSANRAPGAYLPRDHPRSDRHLREPGSPDEPGHPHLSPPPRTKPKHPRPQLFRAPGTPNRVSCPWYSGQSFVPLVLRTEFRAPGTPDRPRPCIGASSLELVPLVLQTGLQAGRG